ncbi:MAG: DNA-3-methyladenine glycosylase family protein [Patescibacteria group bacterium UBA2163]
MKEGDIKKALKHLKKDTHLAPLVTKYGAPDLHWGQKRRSAFQALIKAIIFQQLSGKAAHTILKRFLALYNGRFPSPKRLSETSIEDLRSVGVSGQKASYLHDLAAKFINGTVNPRRFRVMSDEEVFEHVVAVKGVGPWTTDMFLMFTLGRPDILPTGDLGIQNGFKKLFKLKERPTPEKMQERAKQWRPYRTIACWYLWRLADENNSSR